MLKFCGKILFRFLEKCQLLQGLSGQFLLPVQFPQVTLLLL